ncbi:MAG: thiamine phosphate synthase [Candidatus Cloacimonadota bacterium]|nr:MAG: thiamine phosphate synthase [Candidatus Cloacimonadota bacterium]
MKEKGVRRIIDANLNRACEGLRVLEDIVRFTFNNKKLHLRLKKERHTLREIFSEEVSDAIIERDAKGDVGRAPSRLEDKRKNLFEIVTRNLKRVEESLRSLEEVSKLDSKKKAQRIKRMRFTLYSIEKDIQELLWTKKGLKKEGIYVVLPDRSKKELLRLVKAVVDAPVSAVQLRSKSLSARELIKVVSSIRNITAKRGITFIVNDRVDIALAVDADGVHIGQDDIPIKDARKLTGHSFIIGVSTHSIDEAKKAEMDGADYIAFGSIFRTTSKTNAVIQGVKRLKKLTEEVDIPVVAIGGINDNNIRRVSFSGADYAAVISFVSDAEDPGTAVKRLYREFKKGKKRR